MSYKSGPIGTLHFTTAFCNGPGALTGTTEESGSFGSYLVRVYDQITGRSIANVISDASGDWTVNALTLDTDYFCIAFDNNEGTPKNAGIADRQRAEIV